MQQYECRKFVMTGMVDLPSQEFHIIPKQQTPEQIYYGKSLCAASDASNRTWPGLGVYYVLAPEFSHCPLCQEQYKRVLLGLHPMRYTRREINERIFGKSKMLQQEEINKSRLRINKRVEERLAHKYQVEENKNIGDMPSDKGQQIHII